MLRMRKGLEKTMHGHCHILLRDGSKRFLSGTICLILLLQCLLLISCSGDLSDLFGNWNPRGDWEYVLSDEYSIIRINSANICLGRKNGELGFTTVIDSYVTCFAYNDQFVVLRQIAIPDGYLQDEILQLDFEQAQYFILDLHADVVHGPYSEKEDFSSQCSVLKIGELSGWIDTYPAPEGANF